MKKLLFLLCMIALCCGIVSGYTNKKDSLAIDNTIGKDTDNMRIKSNVKYQYKTKELCAKREGNQIYGVVYIPKGTEKRMPAVIFSHGYGGNYQVGTGYAEKFAQNGFVVYCFDFCGGSPDSRSDGSTLEMSLFTEQEDLEAVLAMMQEQAFVDKENIFLMGTSMGGAVSAITAAEHKEEIKGAVLLYPAFVMVDVITEGFERAEDIPDTYSFLWMTVGHDFVEILLDYDIYSEIAGYDREVLLLHGDADGIVPLSSSEKALEVYPSARLEVISGAGHSFSGKNREQATAYILEYLNRCMDGQ